MATFRHTLEAGPLGAPFPGTLQSYELRTELLFLALLPPFLALVPHLQHHGAG
jgi:hypothetical protein